MKEDSRAEISHSGALATHEVFNQSPVFQDVNLFTTDAALSEAVAREGAGWAAGGLARLGAEAGRARARCQREHAEAAALRSERLPSR